MDTEFPFTLPRGFLAPDGTVHRRGVMRLACAADEIIPLEDPRFLGPVSPRPPDEPAFGADAVTAALCFRGAVEEPIWPDSALIG